LDHLSIFEPPEGWLDRNEFEESDSGGSRVRIAMRIKWPISSRRMNVRAVNPRIWRFGCLAQNSDRRMRGRKSIQQVERLWPERVIRMVAWERDGDLARDVS
jgi:hypothetical protein